mgnify:CR=1 FL=1
MQPKNSIRRKPAFPDGMLIVLGVIILCVIVTWFIPSGQYDRILDASGRQIVDPNSFHYIESEKISLLRIPHFIVEGTIAQAEMIFFLLTIGGCYEIVMHTGVLQAIIARMAKWKVRDMAFILVFTLVFAVIAAPAGGVVSFIGFAPIFVMIARAMGYDALVGVSLVLLGGAVGAAAGPITPFTTGVAQGIAELPLYSGLSYRIICMLVLWIVTALFIARYAKKVRLDPSKSYVYDLEQVQKNQEVEKHYDTDLSARQIAILVIFILGLCLIIYGSLRLNWGNRVHMQIYLCMSVILAIVGKFNPNETVRVFVRGAKGMLAAALVLGLSRSISMILDEALVLDTVIYGCAAILNGLPTLLRGPAMLIANTVVNVFIISGSGQAAAVMPVFIPVADLVGLTRQTAVLAFNFGDGFFPEFGINGKKAFQPLGMAFHHISHIIIVQGHESLIIPIPSLHDKAVNTGFVCAFQSFLGVGPGLLGPLAVFRLLCEKGKPVVPGSVFLPVLIDLRGKEMDMAVPDLKIMHGRSSP